MKEKTKYIVEFIMFTALYSFLFYVIFSVWSFDLLWILHPSKGGKHLFAYAISLVIVFRILFLMDRLDFVRKKEEEKMKLIKRKAKIGYIKRDLGIIEQTVFSLCCSDLKGYDRETILRMLYSIVKELRNIRSLCEKEIK